jgi:uncharacterized membrane protein
MLRIRIAAIVAGLLLPVPICAGGSFKFTTVDVPGATSTILYGNNDVGQIVGAHSNGGGFQGFLLSNGTFSGFNDPDGSVTSATRINNSGDIVGTLIRSSDSRQVGFLLSGGVYTTLRYPGAEMTLAAGINNAGQIVGSYDTQNSFRFENGVYSAFSVPGASQTFANAINNVGQIAGTYLDASFNGFAYVLQGGQVTTLAVPGTTFATAFGINDQGDVTGFYFDATGAHGYLYSSGKYTTLDVPGAFSTLAFGINNAGQIVGEYDDSTGTHGFIASAVPEPSSFWLALFPIVAAVLGKPRQKPSKRARSGPFSWPARACSTRGPR